MTFGLVPRTKAVGHLPPPINKPCCARAIFQKPQVERASDGFTLVELLLVVALTLLLASAAIFSFSTLLRGAQLEEGAGQIESLIRFARGEAANCGRKVQLVFNDEANANSNNGGLRVMWEPDPLGSPGDFEEL